MAATQNPDSIGFDLKEFDRSNYYHMRDYFEFLLRQKTKLKYPLLDNLYQDPRDDEIQPLDK